MSAHIDDEAEISGDGSEESLIGDEDLSLEDDGFIDNAPVKQGKRPREPSVESDSEIEDDDAEPKRKDALDREDLALIGAAEGALSRPTKRLKRLKKGGEGGDTNDREAQVAASLFQDDDGLYSDISLDEEEEAVHGIENQPENDDSDDFSDEEGLNTFIVDGRNQPLRRPKRRKKGDSGITQEQMEAATAIFGTDDFDEIFMDDDVEDEMDDVDEDKDVNELRRVRRAVPEKINLQERLRLYEKAFGADALESMFVSEIDEDIVRADIPERIQLIYDNELDEETNWIIKEDLGHLLRLQSTTESFQQLVRNVLEMLIVKKMEVPYIENFAPDAWALKTEDDENVEEQTHGLSRGELWAIYERDQKWVKMNQKKVRICALYDDVIKPSSKEKDQNEDADDVDMMDIDQGENAPAKNAQGSSVDPELIFKIEMLKEDVLRTMDEISLQDFSDHYKFHYISTLPTKYKLPGRSDIARRVRSSGLLPFTKLFGLSSEDYARNVINRSFIRKVKTHTVGPHHAAEDFICREFPTTESVLAAARAYIAEEFACEPRFRTSIRKIVADGAVLSTMPTKIGRREIDMHHRFASVKRLSEKPISAIMQEPNQFGLIKQAVDDKLLTYNIELSRSGMTKLENAMNFFLDDEGSDKVTNDWNFHRKKTLHQTIQSHILPTFFRQLSSMLLEETTENIIRECVQKLEGLVLQGPWKPPPIEGQPDFDPDEGFHIMAVSYGDYSARTRVSTEIVILNERGDFIENLTVTLQRQHAARETAQIRELLDNYQPQAIAVGAESWDSRRAYDEILSIQAAYSAENGDQHSPIAAFVYSDAARIFATSVRAQSEFEGASLGLRKAVSIGRFFLDPLPELAALVNKEGELAFLPLHPLQNLVPPALLQERLERVFVYVVNEVGVDFNMCLTVPRLSCLLNFVSGLGPRKARHLVDTITKTGFTPRTRASLLENNLLKETVYTNAAGFLKFTQDPYANVEQNYLDSMKIHPDDYEYALKMCRTAVEEEGMEEIPEQDVLEAVIRNPASLEDIDIPLFARIIYEKREVHKLQTLLHIKSELESPFLDHREYIVPPPDVVFNWLSGTTPETFYPGLPVTCRLLRPILSEENVLKLLPVRIQEYDLYATCHRHHFPEDLMSVLDPSHLHLQDSVLSGYVLSVDRLTWKIQVSLNKGEQENANKDHLQTFNDRYLLEHELLDLGPEEQIRRKQVYTRALHHPLFKNISRDEAREYLKDKGVGEVIIRPSGSAWDKLIVSWKFSPTGIVELVIVEKEKLNNWSLGKRLALLHADRANAEYEDLNELVVACIDPMAFWTHQVTSHVKFQDIPKGAVSATMIKLKKANLKGLPYRITYAHDFPGRFILAYVPRTQVEKEHISVTPSGLLFRRKIFTHIDELLSWFKIHYKEREPPKPVHVEDEFANDAFNLWSDAGSSRGPVVPTTSVMYPPPRSPRAPVMGRRSPRYPRSPRDSRYSGPTSSFSGGAPPYNPASPPTQPPPYDRRPYDYPPPSFDRRAPLSRAPPPAHAPPRSGPNPSFEPAPEPQWTR